MSEPLVVARDAVKRHAWDEAREAFLAADREELLSPADLGLLADASWWSGHPDEGVDALERAYGGFLQSGDNISAAVAGSWLTYFAMRRGAIAVAAGWKSKAERLLEDEPESPAHAWLQFLRMAEAMYVAKDLDATISLGHRTLELARAHGATAIQAMAQSIQGFALVLKGEWREGMALIDEATAAAASGELDPHSACGVYCVTISCCTSMADYGRAGEWTTEADRWMQRQSLGGYPGECRVHRAELKKLHGSYPEAEQEARTACEELERFHLLDVVGYAHNEIGEIRLRMGDLEMAEEAFLRAYEYGWHAQPGLALIKLARGDVVGAEKDIAAGLDVGEGGPAESDRLPRARLLPARVAIALAAGDLETATSATEELERTAADFERPAFEAAALTARGALELERGHFLEATAALERAWRVWREIDLPYESAQARALLGRARAASGDEATSRMELTAARSAFSRLGAALDVRQVDEWLGDAARSPAGDGRRVTKTFMFTDIVTSTDLVGLIGDGAWEDLLRWHDRALRTEFARYRGQEVRHTGDGFFVAFDRAEDAIDAAVAVQRRLGDHRRDEGFAPWVRVGVHTTEATLQGGDYSGHGVHVAARVGDLAEREEIVASAETLEAAGAIAYPVSEGRQVMLKGVTTPVMIHRIAWR